MQLTLKCRKTQTTNQIRKLQSTLEDELQSKIKKEMELTSNWMVGGVVKEGLIEKTFEQRDEDVQRKTDSYEKIHQENQAQTHEEKTILGSVF